MEFQKGCSPWNKGKKLHYKVWNRGLTGLPPRHITPHSKETKIKCSEAQKLRWKNGFYKDRPKITQKSINKMINTQRKGVFHKCSICEKSVYKSPSIALKSIKHYCSRECFFKENSGSNNCRWKGGITSEDRNERIKFRKKLQKEIFKRDNFTCQICFETGKSLSVDHIKSWSKYPKLRFEKKNCRTLCMACHYFITFKRKLPPNKVWGHNLKMVMVAGG